MDRLGVEKWLKSCNIKGYTINEDLSVDVNGNVDLILRRLNEIPIRFRNVSGNFNCRANYLTTLFGCPTVVGGDFDCRSNELVSLFGCPSSVVGYFNCGNNKLTSLVGCPIEIDGDFDCGENKLSSLFGCPVRVSGFNCSYNELASLDGCPMIATDGFLVLINNNLNEQEGFLYEYTSEQIRLYYINKNLNEKLNGELEEVATSKKKKI